MTTASEISVELNGREVGLSALLTKVDQQSQKAADSALRLQSQYARLAQAQGNTAGATSILSNALLNNNGASAQVVATVSTQLTKLQQGTTIAAEFGTSLKSSLLGAIGPAAAASAALGGVIGVAQSFVDAFNLKASLDATTASVNAQLTGVRSSGQVWAEARQFADAYKLTQQETTEAIAASIGVMRASKAPVEDILGVLARMQVLSPEQSLQEAAVALKALASGDTTSLVTRFEVGRDVAGQMKAEIAGGADAVAVMNKFLNQTGIGMDTLAAKTTGASGALKDVARAQEELALAQAQFAEGPGLKLLEVRVAATRGLTRVLSGDFETARQSIAQFAQEGSFGFQLFNTVMGGSLERIAAYQNAADAAAQTNATWAASGGPVIETGAAIVDIESQRAAMLDVVAAAQAQAVAVAQQHAQSLTEDAAQALIASATTEELAIKKQQLAAQAQAAAQAVLAGGGNIAATAARLASSSSLIDQLTAAYIRLSQAQASAGAAAASNRVPADAQRALGIAQQTALARDRERALSSDLANAERDLAAARRVYGTSSTEAYEAETRVLKARQATQRGGGGGGGRAAAARGEQRTLLTDEQKYQERQAELDGDHAERRLEILQKYYDAVARAQAAFAQTQLDSAASFYDSLGDIENAGIQQNASAEYEAAVQEAAQMGGEAGRRYLEEKEKVILARARRQAEIEQAEQEGDGAKAEYARGVDAKYRAAEDAKLQAIKDGGNQEAAERDRALAEEDARYTEASEKAAAGAEQSAARRAQASAQAGQAVDAEAQKVNTLAKAYERVGNRTGGPAAPAAPPGAPSTAAGDGQEAATTPTAPADLAALLAKLEEVKQAIAGVAASGTADTDGLRAAVVAATQSGASEVARAVRSLGNQSVIAG